MPEPVSKQASLQVQAPVTMSLNTEPFEQTHTQSPTHLDGRLPSPLVTMQPRCLLQSAVGTRLQGAGVPEQVPVPADQLQPLVGRQVVLLEFI